MSTTLTADDFKTIYDDNHTFPFFEDENGYGVYGYGHIDKAEFARLVGEYDALSHYGPDDEVSADDVNHIYAKVVEVADADYEWRLEFAARVRRHDPGYVGAAMSDLHWARGVWVNRNERCQCQWDLDKAAALLVDAGELNLPVSDEGIPDYTAAVLTTPDRAGDLSEQARALVAEGDFPHHPKVIRAVGMLLRMADSLDEARRLYVDLVEAKEVVPLSRWDEMRNQRNEARDALAAAEYAVDNRERALGDAQSRLAEANATIERVRALADRCEANYGRPTPTMIRRAIEGPKS